MSDNKRRVRLEVEGMEDRLSLSGDFMHSASLLHGQGNDSGRHRSNDGRHHRREHGQGHRRDHSGEIHIHRS